MKKLLFAVLFLWAGALWGQNGNAFVIPFNGAPTGSCAFVQFAYNTVTGDLYQCSLGSWVLLATSGGSIAWGSITGLPTTLSGYGITDACGTAGGASCTMVGSIVTGTPAAGNPVFTFTPGVSPTGGSLTKLTCWSRTADTYISCYDGTTTQQIAWQSSLSTMPGVGILAQTNTASPPTLVNRTITGTASYIGVTEGAGTTGNPTITIAAGPVRTRVCEIHVYGSGAAGVLQDTDDVANACTNMLGVTETLTGYGCWVDSTTGSPTATPIMADASTAIVTGAVSCTATTNTLAMGTLSGTPQLTSITLASGACASGNCAVNANITTAGGTATHMKHVFVFTH